MKLSDMTKEEILKVLGHQTIGLFMDNKETIKTIEKSHNDRTMVLLGIFNYGVLLGKRLEREKR